MFTTKRLLACLSMCLLTVTGAFAQTGSIAGTITTATTVTPVITVYDAAGRQVGGATGASYTVSGLTPGAYYVTASATGYVSELYNDVPCIAADCVPTSGTAVTVTSGGTATADFTLTAGGGIQGTVRRALDTSPIGSVTVFLYNAATSFVSSSATAADGTYAFSGLPAGSYLLRVGAPTSGTVAPDYVQELFGGVLCPVIGTSFACRIAQGTPVAVVGGANTTGVDFSLDHGARINGQVTAAGSGLANVRVTAYTGNTPIGVPATTDNSGFYTVQGLPPGTYFVRATPPTNLVEQWYGGVSVASGGRPTGVTVAAGAAAAGIDIALTAGGAISGTVSYTDPGAGTASAQQIPPSIEIYNTAGTLVQSRPLSAFGTASPFAYSITGLPTGTYYVKVAGTATTPSRVNGGSGLFVDELFNNLVCVAQDCLPTIGSPVAVTAGATTAGIDFALDLGGWISGTVAAGTFVDVYDSRGVLLPHRVYRDQFTTGLTDGYHAVGLPAGTYYLVGQRDLVTGNAAELYSGQACSGCAVTFGTPVVVTAGNATTNVNFTGLAGGTIAGTVKDGSPAGLSTITVEVYAASGALAASAATAFDGAYRFAGLAPGTYFARTVNTRGYLDETFDDIACANCSVLTGTPITVAASATATANFVLAAGVPVGGTVRADLGGALPGTGVSLFTSTGTLAAHATANPLGVYLVTLPTGSYRARTDPKPSYVQELYNNTVCASGTCDVTAGTAITVLATPITNVDFSLAACTPRVISPVRLATAAVGSIYRQTLAATGSSSRSFAVSTGALPPGVTLDPLTGVISGTPTASGAFNFTVSVSDSTGCVGTRDYTLDVPPCGFSLAATTTSLPVTGGPFTINVSGSCGTVSALSGDLWITVNSVTPSAVQITAAANTAAAPRTGTVAIGPRVFTVFQGGTTTAAPFGAVDSPADGANVSGSIAITGWALDNLGVTHVRIYRDAVAGEPAAAVFIGDATFVQGARPDVEAKYSTFPSATRAGWGYLLLTNVLPNQGNGTFRLIVLAEDGDLTTTLLGTRTIVVDNATATAPFGAIDTPAQGATVSGTNYTNFGWALTPQPKLIPFSGTTIDVFIDGAPVGPLTEYNQFRSDVSSLFPNLKNSGGPVGSRTIDTTALSEGIHTISWVATDDASAATGIGSRYFTVNNSAWQPSLTQDPDAGEQAQAQTPVPPRVAGPELGRRSDNLTLLPAAQADVALRRDRDGGDPQIVDASETGGRTIAVTELERVDLELGASDVCRASFAGYTIARGEVRDLPIGASLDAAGRFYWQTTPGFIGSYRLVFVRTACDGRRERIPVTIVIQPK